MSADDLSSPMKTFKDQRPKKITKMLTRNAFPCPGFEVGIGVHQL